MSKTGNMKTFVLLSIQGQAPAWYRKVVKGNMAECLEAADQSASAYIRGWFRDPHNESDMKKQSEWAVLRHPMNIIPKKAAAVLKYILSHNIYFNRVGGWCTGFSELKELETVTQENWPTTKLEGARAVIHRWPAGRHYYVEIYPRNIVLKQEKFDTVDEAKAALVGIIDTDKITCKENYGYTIEGD